MYGKNDRHHPNLFLQTMPDFFGKSGNPWIGIQYIVRLNANSQDLTCVYYDGFTNDKKECSFSSLSFLEVCQGDFFTKKFPELFPTYDVGAQGMWYTGIFDGAGKIGDCLLENLNHCDVHTK